MFPHVFIIFQGIEHRRQSRTPRMKKKKIIAESEDTTIRKTVVQTESSSESGKGHTRTPKGRGGYGYRRNSKNNTRDSLASPIKYRRREIEAFGAAIALKYEKLE